MPQMIFINLPVHDLTRSKTFYEALGFSFNPEFTNDNAGCLVISDVILVMLLTYPFFRTFTDRPIADPKDGIAHLLALSRDDRAGVDAITDAALAAGGTETRPAQDYGFMYARAFADPDGHVWEPLHMDLAMMRAGRAATPA